MNDTVVSPQIDGAEFRTIKQPLALDLTAAYTIMQDAAMDLVDQAVEEGWTADQLATNIAQLFARHEPDQAVQKDEGERRDRVCLRKLGEREGYQIHLVDSATVKLTLDPDFTEGANHEAKPYVPTGEIWISDDLDPDDRDLVIGHEITENRLMQNNRHTYDDAHDLANVQEMTRRLMGGNPGPMDVLTVKAMLPSAMQAMTMLAPVWKVDVGETTVYGGWIVLRIKKTDGRWKDYKKLGKAPDGYKKGDPVPDNMKAALDQAKAAIKPGEEAKPEEKPEAKPEPAAEPEAKPEPEPEKPAEQPEEQPAEPSKKDLGVRRKELENAFKDPDFQKKPWTGGTDPRIYAQNMAKVEMQSRGAPYNVGNPPDTNTCLNYLATIGYTVHSDGAMRYGDEKTPKEQAALDKKWEGRSIDERVSEQRRDEDPVGFARDAAGLYARAQGKANKPQPFEMSDWGKAQQGHEMLKVARLYAPVKITEPPPKNPDQAAEYIRKHSEWYSAPDQKIGHKMAVAFAPVMKEYVERWPRAKSMLRKFGTFKAVGYKARKGNVGVTMSGMGGGHSSVIGLKPGLWNAKSPRTKDDAMVQEKIGWHPQGTGDKPTESTIHHEMLHAVVNSGPHRYIEGDTHLRSILDGIKKEAEAQGIDPKTHLKSQLSGYAAANFEEFLAEAWSEYKCNPTPRPVAMAVGKRIESLMDYYLDGGQEPEGLGGW